MTITDAQVKAAADVLQQALFAGGSADLDQIARAALEAGEAAAWSRDLSAAPATEPLLLFRGTSLDTGMVIENRSTGERAWWSGDFRVNPEDIWMWRHVPKPPTEGAR